MAQKDRVFNPCTHTTIHILDVPGWVAVEAGSAYSVGIVPSDIGLCKMATLDM